MRVPLPYLQAQAGKEVARKLASLFSSVAFKHFCQKGNVYKNEKPVL